MRKWKEYSIIYTVGSLGYGLLEIFWRGFTHWSMLFAGGIRMLWLYILNIKNFSMKLWKKCLCGAAIITAVESVVGLCQPSFSPECMGLFQEARKYLRANLPAVLLFVVSALRSGVFFMQAFEKAVASAVMYDV